MPAPRPGGSSRSGAQPDKQQEPAVSGRPSGATAAAGNPSSATCENVAAIRDRASRLGCAANLKPIGEWPAGAGKGIITAPVSRTAGHAQDRDHARHRPVLTAPGRIPGCPGNQDCRPGEWSTGRRFALCRNAVARSRAGRLEWCKAWRHGAMSSEHSGTISCARLLQIARSNRTRDGIVKMTVRKQFRSESLSRLVL